MDYRKLKDRHRKERSKGRDGNEGWTSSSVSLTPAQ